MDLSNAIFLAQSDTTAGFLSVNQMRILNAKNSPKNKAILRESCDLAHIKNITRIPRILQKRIRRANKTTFIFDNGLSFRVVCDDFSTKGTNLHHAFLRRFGTLFSSSANKNGGRFDETFAKKSADIIVSDSRRLREDSPSRIFKVKKSKLKKIR
ncbi:Sua5 YciO YrdC YwlC family protein [Helicobacter sp. 23-1045]